MHIGLKGFRAAHHDLAINHLPINAFINKELIQCVL